jgi:hypothetical protein
LLAERIREQALCAVCYKSTYKINFERNESLMKTHHVVPNSNGGWDVKAGGTNRAIKHFETKQPAIDFGRSVSKNQDSEFFIHGLDGKIQSRDSHGNDPCPPKG